MHTLQTFIIENGELTKKDLVREPFTKLHNKGFLGLFDKKMQEEILEFTDPIILEDGYGFSESKIKIANTVWKKLLKRRLNRKGTKKTHQ